VVSEHSSLEMYVLQAIGGEVSGHLETEVYSHTTAGLTHRVGDVEGLTRQLIMPNEDRAQFQRYHAACLKEAPEVTWATARRRFLDAYREIIPAHRAEAL